MVDSKVVYSVEMLVVPKVVSLVVLMAMQKVDLKVGARGVLLVVKKVVW